jgi:hypothetical protein
MTEVVAVAAFDPTPVAGLGTLARCMTLLIAVATFHDARLVTLARHVALISAVVTGASTSTSHRLTRLSTLGLAVTDEMLARHSKTLRRKSTYLVSPQLKQD